MHRPTNGRSYSYQFSMHDALRNSRPSRWWFYLNSRMDRIRTFYPWTSPDIPFWLPVYVDVTKSSATATAEIVQVGGHYAVQGRSRLMISVPIGSPCHFLILVNNTNLHPISPFVISRNVDQSITFDSGCLSLTNSFS